MSAPAAQAAYDHRPASRSPIQTAIPEFTRSVTLRTAYAQSVYRRNFERLKADLYVLTVRLHANGMEQAGKLVEQQCQEEFVKLGTDLNLEIQRVEVLMAKAGVKEDPTYERAQTFHAKFSTPKANEFLSLLIRMDSLLVRFDALWLTGEIDTHVRVDSSMNWKRRLTKVANRLRARGNQARAKCDEAYRERTRRKRPAATEGQPSPGEGAAGPETLGEEEVELIDEVQGETPEADAAGGPGLEDDVAADAGSLAD